uniref:C2H2-type domain-containing protein n=1 Tax=Nothoprocta perdicaria TaxID=30464 RepID=A0A8C7A5U7_NOTPE
MGRVGVFPLVLRCVRIPTLPVHGGTRSKANGRALGGQTLVQAPAALLAPGAFPPTQRAEGAAEKLPTPEVPLEKLEEEDDRNSGNDDAGKETAACQRGNSRNKFYVCPVCSKSFLLRINLLLHQRSHWVPYMCTHCGGSFTSKNVLKLHQRMHAEQHLVLCPCCDRSFARAADLARHHRAHARERPHQCPECQKSFKKRHSLALHRRSHAGTDGPR